MGVDDLADGVIKNQQFPIDADRRTILRCADLLLDLLNNMQIFIGIHQHGIFPLVTYTLHQVLFLSISDIFLSVERRNTSFHNYMCIVIKHRYQLNFVLSNDSFSNSILNSGAIHEANSQAIIG